MTTGNQTRTNTYTYKPVKFRFLKTKTNPAGHINTYKYDPVNGNVTEIKDSTSSLITSYVYDGFGNKTETHLPPGQVIYNSNEWSLNTLGIGELYYSKSES